MSTSKKQRKEESEWHVSKNDAASELLIIATHKAGATGKRSRIRRRAQDRLAEILTSEEPEQPIETRTFQEYGDWWLQNVAKGSIKANTYQEYGAVLKNHVYPLLGSTRFVEVKRLQMRQLIATKKAEGYEQSRIRNIMAPVRRMYNEAIEDEITEKNPGHRIGKLNKRDKDKPKKKINPLTRQEIQTIHARDGRGGQVPRLLRAVSLCATDENPPRRARIAQRH